MMDDSEARASALESVITSNVQTTKPETKPRGGYMCCVPGCYSNSKREKNLSYYVIPQQEPLRTRWLNAIKKKAFVSNEHH